MGESLNMADNFSNAIQLVVLCNAPTSVNRGGHWGVLENAKPKKKSSKTAKKFGQNRKPHTKPSETDTVVTSAAYRANYTNTLFHQSICECHGLV